MKVKKNSNIELLRIICMFGIVLHHAVLYSDVLLSTSNFLNQILSILVLPLGKIGANCFFAISSYFLIMNDKNIGKKVLKIYKILMFYSITFFGLNILFKFKPVSITLILESFLPFFHNSYWFISGYIIILLVSPYINKLLNDLNCNDHKKLILIIGGLVILPGTLLYKSNILLTSSHIALILLLYLLISYYVRYLKGSVNIKKVVNLLLLNIGVLLILSSFAIVFSNYLGNIKILQIIMHLISGESIFIVIISICIFILFESRIQKNIKSIDLIASGTFDVYLIHMNHFIYDLIWIKLFDMPKFKNDSILFIYIFLASILVFIICNSFGVLRNKLLAIKK